MMATLHAGLGRVESRAPGPMDDAYMLPAARKRGACGLHCQLAEMHFAPLRHCMQAACPASGHAGSCASRKPSYGAHACTNARSGVEVASRRRLAPLGPSASGHLGGHLCAATRTDLQSKRPLSCVPPGLCVRLLAVRSRAQGPAYESWATGQAPAAWADRRASLRASAQNTSSRGAWVKTQSRHPPLMTSSNPTSTPHIDFRPATTTWDGRHRSCSSCGLQPRRSCPRRSPPNGC